MRDWLRPNISRVDYWKHAIGSMCLFLTIIFFSFLPFITNAPESLTPIFLSLAIAIPLYNLYILIGRLRNMGRGFWSGLFSENRDRFSAAVKLRELTNVCQERLS